MRIKTGKGLFPEIMLQQEKHPVVQKFDLLDKQTVKKGEEREEVLFAMSALGVLNHQTKVPQAPTVKFSFNEGLSFTT